MSGGSIRFSRFRRPQGSFPSVGSIRNRGQRYEVRTKRLFPRTDWAGEIRSGRQVTALNIRSLLHPRRIVLDVLSHRRPAACELSCLGLPRSHPSQPPTFCCLIPIKPHSAVVSRTPLGGSSARRLSLGASYQYDPVVFELCDLGDTAGNSGGLSWSQSAR